MQTNQLIAGLMFLMAVGDVLAAWIIGPRLPPDKKPLVMSGLFMSALVFAGLGVAFLIGLIPLGAPTG